MFNFGTTPSTQVPTSTTGFSFGAPKTTAASTAVPAFGVVATAAPSFGATATPFFGAQPAPNYGGLAQETFFFNFGGLTAVSSAASASLNFGTTKTSIGGGDFGKPVATLTAPATSAPTAFEGLGGIEVSTTQSRLLQVKDTQLSEEIAKTLESFKTYNKTQKTHCSEIGRISTSTLTNVSREIMNQQSVLQKITNAVESNYNQIKILGKEISEALQSAEMAQRTQATPAELQFENNAPFQFIQDLVDKYEHELINIRHQIASMESHMRSLTNPQKVAPKDLKRCLRQIHKSLIALAGRLHEIDQEVESQKELFFSLRKFRLRDSTNVFAELDNPQTKVNTTDISAGPSAFVQYFSDEQF